jgi:MerR family copper efflux transcriptional regulator
MGDPGACGPDCACLKPAVHSGPELPIVCARLIGAACTLGTEELRQRVDEWRALRDRATAIDEIEGGARLTFNPDEPMEAVANLVSLESECCSFYTFTLQIDGPARRLEISAGTGGEPAVRALLGLT